MHALKARVENGRYVIDEPAELPEGAEVELMIVKGAMSAEERAELLEAIEEAELDIEAGRVVDEAEVWARLQAIS
jgi:anti-sigma28 factor (negative regulator of flagellin synthesis)